VKVRLSNGKVVKSRQNEDVPEWGYLAGGGDTPHYVAFMNPTLRESASSVDPAVFEDDKDPAAE
jgi:hypothetical protein